MAPLPKLYQHLLLQGERILTAPHREMWAQIPVLPLTQSLQTHGLSLPISKMGVDHKLLGDGSKLILVNPEPGIRKALATEMRSRTSMFTWLEWAQTLSNLLHQGLRQPNMRAQTQDGMQRSPSSLGPSVSWGMRGYKQPFPPGEDSRGLRKYSAFMLLLCTSLIYSWILDPRDAGSET